MCVCVCAMLGHVALCCVLCVRGEGHAVLCVFCVAAEQVRPCKQASNTRTSAKQQDNVFKQPTHLAIGQVLQVGKSKANPSIERADFVVEPCCVVFRLCGGGGR